MSPEETRAAPEELSSPKRYMRRHSIFNNLRHRNDTSLEQEGALSGTYSILVSTLVIAAVIVIVRVVVQQYTSWSGEMVVKDLSLVFTGLFFILGQMFSTVNADMKEALKMPMELTCILDLVEDYFQFAAAKIENAEEGGGAARLRIRYNCATMRLIDYEEVRPEAMATNNNATTAAVGAEQKKDATSREMERPEANDASLLSTKPRPPPQFTDALEAAPNPPFRHMHHSSHVAVGRSKAIERVFNTVMDNTGRGDDDDDEGVCCMADSIEDGGEDDAGGSARGEGEGSATRSTKKRHDTDVSSCHLPTMICSGAAGAGEEPSQCNLHTIRTVVIGTERGTAQLVRPRRFLLAYAMAFHRALVGVEVPMEPDNATAISAAAKRRLKRKRLQDERDRRMEATTMDVKTFRSSYMAPPHSSTRLDLEPKANEMTAAQTVGGNAAELFPIVPLTAERSYSHKPRPPTENAFSDCLNILFDINYLCNEWGGDREKIVVRVPRFLDMARRMTGRASVIKRTDVFPAAMALMNYFTLMSCILMFLATYKTIASLIVGMMCTMGVSIFMSRILMAMDDPFVLKSKSAWRRWLFGHSTAVEMYPVIEYCRRMDRIIRADEALEAVREEARARWRAEHSS